MILNTHDESQRTLGKAYAGADNTVTYVDRFRVGHIWHGMKTDADGTLPFCMDCALYLIEEGAALDWARPGAPGDQCDCCAVTQHDLDFEEESLKAELVAEGKTEEHAHIIAGDWVYSLLAFARDWDENVAGKAQQ
jgi:hypothetical protein